MTAASTTLSAVLTLLPEVLAWETVNGERIRKQKYERANYNKEEKEQIND